MNENTIKNQIKEAIREREEEMTAEECNDFFGLVLIFLFTVFIAPSLL